MELMQRRRELMTFEHGHWATATGGIATFNTPFAKPLRSLKVEFSPVQEGTGDPSPDNIRPITGWTGLTAYRTGKNIWDEQWERGSYNASTGEPKDIYDSNIRSKATSPIPIKPNTSYYVYIGKAINVRCLFYTEKDEFISAPTAVRNSIITSPPSARLMRFYVGAGYGGTYGNNIAINYPATATTYAPYSGTTTPVDWTTEASTVYGGYVDLVKGELVQEWYYGYTITHNTNFAIWRNGYYSFWMRNPNSTTPRALYVDGAKNAVCDILKACSNIDIYNARDYGVCVNNSGGIAWRVEGITTVEEMQTWLEAHPLTIGYKLANPIVHQLTPQQITALIGTNSIWSTANGNVTAEYWTR